MNQKIVDYLGENKEQYSQKILVEQLKKVGYSEIEIDEAVKSVYVAKDIPLPKQAHISTSNKISSKDTPYASFWLRVGAALIDGIIGYVVYVVFKFFATIGGYLIGGGIPGVRLGMAIAGAVFMIDFIYRTVMVYYYQATLGKLIAGIKVCDENTFNKLSFQKVVTRELLGSIMNRFYLNFIHIIVNFTPKKQSVHDMASQAVVVQKNKV